MNTVALALRPPPEPRYLHAAPHRQARRPDSVSRHRAGSQTVEPAGTDSVRAEYSFNDRGRGDHIVATWKLDAAGVPIEYSGSGNDYMKAAVTETFSLSSGKAKWHNRSEQGEKAVKGESFYVPANAPPEFTGVLARALLKAPGHTLPLLPAGEAHIRRSRIHRQPDAVPHHRPRLQPNTHLARPRRQPAASYQVGLL